MNDLPDPTARLFFRHWGSEDLPLAVALWCDDHVTALIGGPLTQTQARQRLEEQIELQRQHGFQYWPIFLRDGGDHLGCCGLRPRDLEQRILELGFHLRAEYWGKGYATESARRVAEYAFSKLGARSLFAGHHPANLSSRRTLERLGFRHTHDELYPPTGAQHPSYLLTPDGYRSS